VSFLDSSPGPIQQALQPLTPTLNSLHDICIPDCKDVETLLVASGMKTVKGGGRLGLKVAKKVGENFIKRAEEAGHLRKVAANRNNAKINLAALDLAGSADKKMMGEYRHVRGHHVHAKKAFEGHVNYDPKKGFSISEDLMNTMGIEHKRVTTAQQKFHRTREKQ
jgi:hypothetical protein